MFTTGLARVSATGALQLSMLRSPYFLLSLSLRSSTLCLRLGRPPWWRTSLVQEDSCWGFPQTLQKKAARGEQRTWGGGGGAQRGGRKGKAGRGGACTLHSCPPYLFSALIRVKLTERPHSHQLPSAVPSPQTSSSPMFSLVAMGR